MKTNSGTKTGDSKIWFQSNSFDKNVKYVLYMRMCQECFIMFSFPTLNIVESRKFANRRHGRYPKRFRNRTTHPPRHWKTNSSSTMKKSGDSKSLIMNNGRRNMRKKNNQLHQARQIHHFRGRKWLWILQQKRQ